MRYVMFAFELSTMKLSNSSNQKVIIKKQYSNKENQCQKPIQR